MIGLTLLLALASCIAFKMLCEMDALVQDIARERECLDVTKCN